MKPLPPLEPTPLSHHCFLFFGFFKVFGDRVFLYSWRIVDVSRHVWFTVLF